MIAKVYNWGNSRWSELLLLLIIVCVGCFVNYKKLINLSYIHINIICIRLLLGLGF